LQPAALKTSEWKRTETNLSVAKRHAKIHGSGDHDSTVLSAAILGTQPGQSLMMESHVIVGPTSVGDVPYAITFNTPFPNYCDGIIVMFGDQVNYGIATGYVIGGWWIIGKTKTGFTLYIRYTATPGSAANIYFYVFAFGH
jgi:hypothetical protein